MGMEDVLVSHLVSACATCYTQIYKPHLALVQYTATHGIALLPCIEILPELAVR